MLIRLKVILYLTIQYYFPSVDLSPSSGQRRYTTKLILIKIIIDVCINDCYYYLLLVVVSSISTATDGHKLYLHAYMDKNIFFIIN